MARVELICSPCSVLVFLRNKSEVLSSGHSFLSYDRYIALIENGTSETLTPGNWKYIITEDRLNKPFVIIEMQQSLVSE